MLRDFCQNCVPMNNPQSEVEARIDEFLTDARNVSNRAIAETLHSAAASPSQRSFSISAEGPIYPCTPPPHTPALPTPAQPTHPSTPPPLHTAVPLPSTGSIQLPPPLYYRPTLHPLRFPVCYGAEQINHNLHQLCRMRMLTSLLCSERKNEKGI